MNKMSTIFTLLILAVSQLATAEIYYPPTDGEWVTASPADAGLCPEAVESALTFARERNSSGVVITHNGRMVAERYWTLDDPARRYVRMRTGTTDEGHPIEDVASVQKSVVSFLTAMARDRDKLKLTDFVSEHIEVGWSGAHRDQEAAITIRHLLSMTSGLTPRLTFQSAPGTRWQYNTNAYAKMLPVLEAATGQDIRALTAEWLTGPIGMTHSSWTKRSFAGGLIDANSVGFSTTPRDLARFGILVLTGGEWDGDKLLGNADYLDESLKSSQRLNPAYGFLWWLNGQEAHLRPGSRKLTWGTLNPEAPDDLVGAFGALGRKCYVVPSRGLVVTRLGDEPGEAFDREFWKRLLNE